MPKGSDAATVLAPGYDKQLLDFKKVGQHSVSVYGANLTANSTRAHRQWLAEHQETLKSALALQMREYPKRCPPAAKLAKELSTNYTTIPYVHVVTTPTVNDLLHYGDDRSGGYFTFTHDYIRHKIKFLFLEFNPVPATCIVHVVIGF
uniref:Uncharacterized protein n=1 Tax=Steinernema glaseri TaxID=37863 RepID=A0A1I7YP87_9BILA